MEEERREQDPHHPGRQRGAVRAAGRPGPVARRRAARRPRADRHQTRVQRGRVRVVRRAPRRRRRQLLPRARRAGAGAADHDDRGPRPQRHARPGAGGVRDPLRVPVRLLHARDDHDREGVPGHEPDADRGRGPPGDPRQPLPLHRLLADRRRDHGRVRPDDPGARVPAVRAPGRRPVAAARRLAREGHRQGAVRVRHAAARDAARRDPAQPAPVGADPLDRHLGRRSASRACSPSTRRPTCRRASTARSCRTRPRSPTASCATRARASRP